MVLFLYKLPDETAANRRVAKALVEKWSRPIFDQYRERRDTSEVDERELQLLQVHDLGRDTKLLLLQLRVLTNQAPVHVPTLVPG